MNGNERGGSLLSCESKQNKEKHILSKFRTDLCVVWMECREMLVEHPVNSAIIYYRPTNEECVEVFRSALWMFSMSYELSLIFFVTSSSSPSTASRFLLAHHVLLFIIFFGTIVHITKSTNDSFFWMKWIQNIVQWTGHLTMVERGRNIFRI